MRPRSSARPIVRPPNSPVADDSTESRRTGLKSGTNGSGTGDRINNGALDNAAGTATLLEVARAFATAAERPRRSVLVVANTAEEKGLLGAEYFAHYPTVPIERIVAGIDLDMPLLLYDFTDVVAYGSTHSSLETAFQKAAAGMGVRLSPRSNARAGHLCAIRSLCDGEGRRPRRDVGDGAGERRSGGVGEISGHELSPPVR